MVVGWDAAVPALVAGLAAWLVVRDGGLARLRVRRGRRVSGGPTWVRPDFATRKQAVWRRRVAGGVPLTCDLLAVVIEAGRPVRGALKVVAEASEEPTREVLSAVVNQVELGVEETDAWASLGRQPGYRAVARDVGRSLRSGIALGDRLRAHSSDARAAAEADARARARRVSVTAVVPLVACFLPAFLLVGVVPIFGGLLTRLFG